MALTNAEKQYHSLKTLKENLKPNHLIVQMDFAENFSCVSADEVQSAYWNCEMVTIHPIVAYSIQDGVLTNHNFAFISDCLNHNSTAVLTILNELVPLLKNINPNVNTIHYWTDSLSSQYRNRYIFNEIVEHKSAFGVQAKWNFFEAGHGKGPCDSLGGTLKRKAQDAIKQGKVCIQDASEFFNWAKENISSIHCLRYTQQDYNTTSEKMAAKTCKAVPGTMKLHAVSCTEEGVLHTRDLSCYCEVCREGFEVCGTWSRHTLRVPMPPTGNEHNNVAETSETKNLPATCRSVADKTVANQEDASSVVPSVDKHYLIVYDGKKYPGKVLEVDQDEGDAYVSFMEESRGKSSKKLFKWPPREVLVWSFFHDFYTEISEPIPYGKSGRMFALSDEDYKHL